MIRQFLYLDEYKMYSLYAQLCEGFSEHVLRYETDGKDTRDSHPRPIGGVRALADIAANRRSPDERRFLHDYAYTVFEGEMSRRSVLTTIAPAGDGTATLAAGQLVKVTGGALFNDTRAIAKLLERFNELGAALTYVTTFSDREAALERSEPDKKDQPERSARTRRKEVVTRAADVEEIARARGLRRDERFLQDLASLLELGYGGHFEVRLRPLEDGNHTFYSALLKRECLRESESLLVTKMGRKAEGRFSLIGITTQVGQPAAEGESKEDMPPLKQAILDMAESMARVSGIFTGRLGTEYVIDPIAVYRELEGVEGASLDDPSSLYQAVQRFEEW